MTGVAALAAGGGIGFLLYVLTRRKKRRRRRRELPAARDIVWGGRRWTEGELRAFLRRELGPLSAEELAVYFAATGATVSDVDALLALMRDVLGMRDDALYERIAGWVAAQEPLLDPWAGEAGTLEDAASELRDRGDALLATPAASDAEGDAAAAEADAAYERAAALEARAAELRRSQAIAESEPEEPQIELPPPPPPPPSPAPGLEAAPEPVYPAGYDPDRARTIAPIVAAAIRAAPFAGSTIMAVTAFQLSAWGEGDQVDGKYGGATKGALRYYGIDDPPAAVYKPRTEAQYTPPEPIG